MMRKSGPTALKKQRKRRVENFGL